MYRCQPLFYPTTQSIQKRSILVTHCIMLLFNVVSGYWRRAKLHIRTFVTHLQVKLPGVVRRLGAVYL